jgi:hypothetical protein
MNVKRIPLMVLATVALAWGLAAGAGTPVSWHDAEVSVLRLSWSAHPERIETCRERTPEELAERPAHMRQPLDCEGTAATYLLEVRVDGELLDSAVVRGSGIRNDRPIFLLRDYVVSPGPHQVRVAFTRREENDEPERDEPEHDDAGERAAPSRGSVGAIAPHLELHTPIRFASGGVALVTYRGDALVLLTR